MRQSGKHISKYLLKSKYVKNVKKKLGSKSHQCQIRNNLLCYWISMNLYQILEVFHQGTQNEFNEYFVSQQPNITMKHLERQIPQVTVYNINLTM